MNAEPHRRRDTWSLELVIAVLLPVAAILACIALIRLSSTAGFTRLDPPPGQTARVDS